MSKTTKLLPELRFPEFREDGEWVHLYGNKLFAQINDRNHNGDLPVLAITQEHGAIPRDLINYNVSVSKDSVNNYKIIRVGDFIISLRSFQGGIEFSDYEGLCSPAYIVLRKKHDTDSRFFKHLFKSKMFIRELTKNLEGLRDGKMISYKQFSEVAINLPSKAEQQKIADCLGSLDDLIAAHCRKLTALQDHKKGLLQQLFPAEGETTPELRFSNDRNEWEETKLEMLCDSISSGKDHREADGTFDLYGSTGAIGKTAKASYNGLSILIARVGANAGLLNKVEGQYGVTDNTLVVTLNPSINIDYIFYYLGNININKLIFGSGQPLITGRILKKLRIILPTDAEQQKVANCLCALDALITAQIEQIADLKDHKKGLMQQLFPNPESSQP
jgi:type I restriction enzyme S subunit